MNNVVINGGASDPTTIYDVVIVLGSVFMVLVLRPLLKWNRGRPSDAASADEQRANSELWDRARRMETRIEYLERVLDSEMPGWRNRS